MDPTPSPRFSTRRVEAHGLGIHVIDWPGASSRDDRRPGPRVPVGAAVAPPPIVMLHGLGFTGRLFDPLARALSPAYRVLCPDLRGHGRTDHPPEGYQYPNLVRDLVALLQMMQLPRVILLGHTWGADVAMSFAAAQPGRLAGLILIDGGFRHRREIPGNEQPPSPDQVKPGAGFASIEAAVEDARAQLGVTWTDDLQNAVVDSLEVNRDGTVSYRLDDHRWGQIYKQLWAYDPSSHLTSVQTPTLLVHPAGPDPASPQGSVAAFQARAAALLMPNARLLRLPDRDNLSLLASPTLREEIEAFVREVGTLPPKRRMP